MEFIEKQNNYNVLLNFVVLGDYFVGKTILSKRVKIINKKLSLLPLKYKSTISPDFDAIYVKINDKIIHINLWDCDADVDIPRMGIVFPSNSDAFLILYDAQSRKSFEKAIKIYKYIKEYINRNKGAIYILVRSKYELNKIEQDNGNNFVSDEEALEFVEKNNIIFCHISSLQQHESGRKELFSLILKRLFRERTYKQMEKFIFININKK